VGNTVKDESDSIRFLVLLQSWILGGGASAHSATHGYACVHLSVQRPRMLYGRRTGGVRNGARLLRLIYSLRWGVLLRARPVCVLPAL